MATGGRRRRGIRYGLIGLFVVLLVLTSIPGGGYQATARLGSEMDEERFTDPSEYVVVGTLSAPCQQVARQVLDGQPVSERGYRLAPLAGGGVLQTTNVTGGWRLAAEFCLDRLTAGYGIRYEGTYYDLHYGIHRGHDVDPLLVHRTRFWLLLAGMLYTGYWVAQSMLRTV